MLQLICLLRPLAQSLPANPLSRSESTQSRRPSKIPIHVSRRQISAPGTSTDKQMTQRDIAHSEKKHPERIRRQLSFSEEASSKPSSHKPAERQNISHKHRNPPLSLIRQQSIPLKSGLTPPLLSRSVSFAPEERRINPIHNWHPVLFIRGVPIPNSKILNPENKFRQLSPRMLKWKFVGRYLLLGDKVLSDIQHEYSHPAEQCYHMLIHWYDIHQEQATYARLAQALVDTRQECLFEEFRAMISNDEL